MDDLARNQFESLATLWRGAWDQFNERRKYEFQISLAIWTALASFTAFVISGNANFLKDNNDIFAGLMWGLVAIFVVYSFWRLNLAKANQKDIEIAYHYERLLQVLSNSEFDNSLKKKLAKSKLVEKFPVLLGWSQLTQIAVTAILCAATGMAVYCKYKS